jgi:hypothetical protein
MMMKRQNISSTSNCYHQRHYHNHMPRLRTLFLLVLPIIQWMMMMLIIMRTNVDIVCVSGKKTVRIIAPLRSLTIWDDAIVQHKQRRRDQFLQTFRIGLQAEVDAMMKQQQDQDHILSTYESNDPHWSRRIEQQYRTIQQKKEQMIERAYDTAIQQYQQQQQQQKLKQQKSRKQPTHLSSSSSSLYQFVGVIQPRQQQQQQQQQQQSQQQTSMNTKEDDHPIIWYARRKKNVNTDWTIRFVHVNRPMILYDLFRRRCIDIFATYHNHGMILPNHDENDTSTTSTLVATSTQRQPASSTKFLFQKPPTITSQYHVRVKSWK